MSPKPHHAAPEQRFLRRVVSVTTDGVLVHLQPGVWPPGQRAEERGSETDADRS